mmetsp:Transcript_5169/g.14591  ORF Transcript_5169/g.14591 Transcript_5169/m.14591 type:complete len:214 (+) Transcript_5169:232-873(+)
MAFFRRTSSRARDSCRFWKRACQSSSVGGLSGTLATGPWGSRGTGHGPAPPAQLRSVVVTSQSPKGSSSSRPNSTVTRASPAGPPAFLSPPAPSAARADAASVLSFLSSSFSTRRSASCTSFQRCFTSSRSSLRISILSFRSCSIASSMAFFLRSCFRFRKPVRKASRLATSKFNTSPFLLSPRARLTMPRILRAQRGDSRTAGRGRPPRART